MVNAVMQKERELKIAVEDFMACHNDTSSEIFS